MMKVASSVARASRRGSLSRREALAFYLFASPWIIGLFIWTAGPMIASLVLSLAQYDVITPPQFIGLANYVKMLTNDTLVWQSLK
jgi:multiple sugar transport system permease protein